MAYFLFKTEPGEYSFDDLVRDGACVWEGVSNAAALIHLRSVRPGDRIFIYHTGDQKSIVGMAEASSGPRADKSRPELTADGQPKFAVVDLRPVKAAARQVALAAIKADARFKDFGLVKQSRLSVMPVPPALAGLLQKWGGLS